MRQDEDGLPRWAEWLKLLPIIFAVVLPLLAGAITFIQARVDAANVAQSEQLRREYISKEVYEKDEAVRGRDRQELREWMDKIDKKLDRLAARK